MTAGSNEQELAWKSLVSASPLAMWVVEGGRCVVSNGAAAALFALSEEEAPAFLEELRLPQQRFSEVNVRRADGSQVRVRGVSWEAGPGVTICQAEAVSFSTGPLASSADCVKVLTLEGRVVYINPQGRVLMAVDDFEQVRDAEWVDFWRGEHRDAAASALEGARRGEAARFVGLCPRFTGEMRWWDVVVSPIRDSEGTVTGLLSVSRDVTEMKQAQLIESVERRVLEAAVSTRPITEVLDAICGLAEFAAESKGICSLLATGVTTPADFRFVSFPARTNLVGIGVRAATGFLQEDDLADYTSPEFPALLLTNLHGPDGALVGAMAMWCSTGIVESASLRSTLEICANIAAVALVRDAHLRRLRQKQDRLTAIGRSMPIGLYQCDLSGTWTYANERYGQLTGLRLEECSDEGWLASVHPEDRESVAAQWRQAREQQSTFRTEYRLAAEEGAEPSWVLAEEAPGGVESRIGTIADITDLKRAQQQGAEAAQRFEDLANNISQFSWMADAAGWVFWYSKRWYDYTGTTLEQMRGWGWRAVHHPEHVDRVVTKITKCWQTGEVWEDTFPLRSKDGSYRWFLSRALPIRDENGRILRWFGTNTDVTELRELEAKLHQQNLALQRSNEELSRFAFIASHDLQEPLRMIVSFAQLALRPSATQEKTQQHLERIVDAARRMSRLIKDVLAYSRVSGDSEHAPELFSLGEIVPPVLENLRGLTQETAADIRIEEGLPPVFAVKTQVAQVLQNILSNAMKYRRPEVPLRVRVSTERQGDYWRISVCDNGQGFAQGHASRIFDFLKRLHGEDVPGSGIGLSICKSIIQRNGGEIGAEGVPGEGATFWFTLPASEAGVSPEKKNGVP